MASTVSSANSKVRQSTEKDMKKAWWEELVGTLDNHGPTKTATGNCGTTWSVNLDKSWEEEEGTKVWAG